MSKKSLMNQEFRKLYSKEEREEMKDTFEKLMIERTLLVNEFLQLNLRDSDSGPLWMHALINNVVSINKAIYANDNEGEKMMIELCVKMLRESLDGGNLREVH